MREKENFDRELRQINVDIIFFFLLVVSSLVSFYVINEKKKNHVGLPNIGEVNSNKIYRNNRKLLVIINGYFLLNAYLSYIEAKNKNSSNMKRHELLLMAQIFGLISALLYLPLGNDNLIIDN